MTLRVHLDCDERLHNIIGGFGSRVFTRCGLEGELYENADYVSGESIRAELLCPECDRLEQTGLQRASNVAALRSWECLHGYVEAVGCPVVDCPDAARPFTGHERIVFTGSDLIGPERSEGPCLAPRPQLHITREARQVLHAEHTPCKSPLSVTETPRLTVVDGEGCRSGSGSLEVASDGNVAGELALVGPAEGSASAATTGGCSR